MEPYDVITFGDLCVDLLVSGGDIVPRFGQAEQLVGDYALEMGGSCGIFACQAAKLGLRVALMGRVGDDAFGQLIVRRLRECGVDTAHVVVDLSLRTGLSIALSKDGDRSILTYTGSIAAIEPRHVTKAFLASARHLHYGSFFLHTGLRPAAPDVFRRARALGLTISLDTNWDPEEHWNSTLAELLPLTDVFLPNEHELLAISRCRSPDEGAAWVRGRGVPIVVVKRGSAGARAYDERGRHDCAVAPARPGGDSVGAGDSFDAGFLLGWLRGMTIAECLGIACQCGRRVAGAVGGLRGQPTWDDLSSAT